MGSDYHHRVAFHDIRQAERRPPYDDLRSPDLENLGSGAFCDLGSPMAGRQRSAYCERKRR